MRACFLKNNVCALGYGVAVVQARMDTEEPALTLFGPDRKPGPGQRFIDRLQAEDEPMGSENPPRNSSMVPSLKRS